MPRRGRSASPPPAPQRRAAPPPAPSRVPAHAPPSTPAPAMAQPQQPSMFGQMAATAGGVAVGSAVGHVAGEAITSLFSGRRREEVVHALPRDYQLGSEPSGPCAYEISQFLHCATNNDDISQCQAYNEALKQCKQHYRLP
ncbi:coiled-coil-helix-coiled-coil-helix domain-containing protein 10, mitochondrial-like isoform X2 [Spodoptera frugiperda]|uniref:Coiled-coil-helix-coiled-coil-helix domain-containing protein 10, mitochondrial-like isoform X2 n=1 Tax=Spodoptera frugiperda TaxID=7108 RepID=A0A9R0E533_SPOFR|nr:coiled-coil-helix-coiled-coil-helix domain-containing protein 10, mitochondrial-like isoform X2 [Spodoptera frugiperda]